MFGAGECQCHQYTAYAPTTICIGKWNQSGTGFWDSPGPPFHIERPKETDLDLNQCVTLSVNATRTSINGIIVIGGWPTLTIIPFMEVRVAFTDKVTHW